MCPLRSLYAYLGTLGGMFRVALLFTTVLASCATSTDPTVSADLSPETAPPQYVRRDWGRWADADGDCQDTRQEILIRDSSVPATLDEKGCRVVAGRWVDPYDGREVLDPSKIDVDHVVALRNAHDSGGWQWGAHKKRAFANDPDNLKATSQSTNRSKGARGPDRWLPPRRESRCDFIVEWITIKGSYSLESSAIENGRVMQMLGVCGRGEIPELPQG